MLLKTSEGLLHGVVFLNVFQDLVHPDIPSDVILDLTKTRQLESLLMATAQLYQESLK
jgi:hypothetical protein